MLYNEDNIKINSSINKLPEMTLNEQKGRNLHLKMYKKLNIPILSYPKGIKDPIVPGWNKAEVKTLWKQQKEELKIWNLGMRLENYMVIDIDDPAITKEKLSDLQLPATAVVFRGERDPEKILQWEERGHVYFKRPDWLKFKNTKKLKDLGIELRTGCGSQNVIPDSIHPEGDRYKWYKSDIFRDSLPIFPKDLFDEIINRANIFHEDETAEIEIIEEEEATPEFFRWKKILDQLINRGYSCTKEDYTANGQSVSRGLLYKGYCPMAARHSQKEGNSSPTEFLIHLSYSGAIRKHCHHTHCSGMYKEKLEDLFKFNINNKEWYFLDEDEDVKIEEVKEKPDTCSSGDSEKYYKSLGPIRTIIYETRIAEKRQEVDKNETCFRKICNFLEDNGVFIKDKNNICYYFDKNRKLTYQIDSEDPDYSVFLHCIGLAGNEMITKIINKRLQSHCLLTGYQVDVKKFCYYDRKNFTLYLDLRNEQNQILKITTDTMDIVDNGTEGIMFQRCQGTCIDIKLPLSGPSNKFEEIILERINFDIEETNLTVDEQQLFFELFFMALFFESIFPTKPLLLLLGVKGSGKSFSIRVMGKLLFGEDWNLSSVTAENERDIKVASIHKSFLGIDNADSRIKWMNDFLAKMATGEQFEEREMRTNNKYIVMKPQCFIGLTARTPKFRRDDIADRLIILSVKPLENNFLPENDLLEELEENRQSLWIEIIFKLQGILRQLKQNHKKRYVTKFRMADFYSFTCKIAGEEHVKEIFKKMQQQQYNFSLEEDPIYELLQLYMEDAETIEGEFLSAKDLFYKLRVIAESDKINFPYKTVISLASKLRHQWKGLQTKFNCKLKKERNYIHYCFQKIQNST